MLYILHIVLHVIRKVLGPQYLGNLDTITMKVIKKNVCSCKIATHFLGKCSD